LRFGETKIVDDDGVAPVYFAEHARYQAILLAAPINLLYSLCLEVDTIQPREHMSDKAWPALLAVGQEIEADFLLVLYIQSRSVVLRFL
jgi:hypothetical protein